MKHADQVTQVVLSAALTNVKSLRLAASLKYYRKHQKLLRRETEKHSSANVPQIDEFHESSAENIVWSEISMAGF